MRTLTFSPIYQPTSGLDRVFDLIEAAAQRQGDDFPTLSAPHRPISPRASSRGCACATNRNALGFAVHLS
jgi:hypothetical protein